MSSRPIPHAFPHAPLLLIVATAAACSAPDDGIPAPATAGATATAPPAATAPAAASVPARASPPPIDPTSLPIRPGDPRQRIDAVYGSVAYTKTDDLMADHTESVHLADRGLWFFIDQGKVESVRIDAPFKGAVEGVRIGDTREQLLRAKGAPSAKPFAFSGSDAYVYRSHDVRYDVSRTTKTVVAIFLLGPPKKVERDTSTASAGCAGAPAAPSESVDRTSMPLSFGDTLAAVEELFGKQSFQHDGMGHHPSYDQWIWRKDQGLRFFFLEGKLQTVRLDTPFDEAIDGVRIGDTREQLLAKKGPPSIPVFKFVGRTFDAHVYCHPFVRYDVSNRSDRVESIFLASSSDERAPRGGPAGL